MHPVSLVVMASVLALVPIFIGLTTSYLKVNIILGLMRSGLGTQQVPSGLVITALSLGLTAYIMGPVVGETAEILKGMKPEEITSAPTVSSITRLSELFAPWRKFMEKQCGERELQAFSSLKRDKEIPVPITNQPPDAGTIIAAFVMTEIKEACAMGFVVLLPFLVIDLIVANILVGMGMYMVSPVMISLPLKLLLLVSTDAWIVILRAIVDSYGG